MKRLQHEESATGQKIEHKKCATYKKCNTK